MKKQQPRTIYSGHSSCVFYSGKMRYKYDSQRIEEKTASQDQYLQVGKVHYSGPMRGDSCAKGTIYRQHKAECCESGVRRRMKRPAAKLLVKSFWNALVAELRYFGHMSRGNTAAIGKQVLH